MIACVYGFSQGSVETYDAKTLLKMHNRVEKSVTFALAKKFRKSIAIWPSCRQSHRLLLLCFWTPCIDRTERRRDSKFVVVVVFRVLGDDGARCPLSSSRRCREPGTRSAVDPAGADWRRHCRVLWTGGDNAAAQRRPRLCRVWIGRQRTFVFFSCRLLSKPAPNADFARRSLCRSWLFNLEHFTYQHSTHWQYYGLQIAFIDIFILIIFLSAWL